MRLVSNSSQDGGLVVELRPRVHRLSGAELELGPHAWATPGGSQVNLLNHTGPWTMTGQICMLAINEAVNI